MTITVKKMLLAGTSSALFGKAMAVGGTVGSQETEYAKHLGFKAAAGSVNVVKKHASMSGGVLNATTVIPVSKGLSDGGCRVGCSGARTINLGNYESVKITAWLEMPCSKEDVNTTYDFITDWIGKQLEDAVKQAKE